MLENQPYGEFDQHYRTPTQIDNLSYRSLSSYELNEEEGRIYIHDQVWGDEVIGDQPGDQIFLELFRHPVFERLWAIEQLTLPKIYETMPGSSDFTRGEHAWGSVVFVRKMISQAEESGREFGDKEKVELQLRTLLSDAGHTAFSHLGDWLKQSFGGTEDSHDLGLAEYLELTGVNDVLRRHDIEPETVTMPESACDFVECPSPDLCTDRVDYGCREIERWVDPMSAGQWLPAFSIDEQNRLVMRDEKIAKRFGLSFGLLPTEHWGHPVHRLQLQLFAEIVKGAVLSEPTMLRSEQLHPHDMLHTIDSDIMTNVRAYGTLNNDLHALLLDIARAQRRIFAWGREKDVSQFLSDYAGEFERQDSEAAYLQPLEARSWNSEYSGVKPQNTEFIPVESVEDVRDFGQNPYSYDVYSPSLKPRAVDPLYYAEDGSTRRLSEHNETYKELMRQQRAVQKQSYVARVYMAPDAVASLREKIKLVQKEWEEAVANPRNEKAAQRLLSEDLGMIGRLAITRSPNELRLVY